MQSMTRSNDTLTKSIITAPDYKKMMSKGSIDSMDKSVISSNTSLGGYEPQHIQHKLGISKSKYSPTDSDSTPIKKAAIYDQKISNTPSYDPYGNGFELSYRNEGFRDNSSFNTRNNSYGTNINDDTPIVHHTDIDDSVSDFYGKSSTLPIRARGDNLSFLTELKSQLPEYEQLNSAHSSFLANTTTATNPTYDQSPGSFQSFGGEKKSSNGTVSTTTSHSPKSDHQIGTDVRKPVRDYAQPIRLHEPDITRRPDSYYTAMRNARDSQTVTQNPNPQPNGNARRPKAVYQSATVYDRPVLNLRSKSEALLEANFDAENTAIQPQLTSDNRSFSQPMETAM